MEHRDACDLIRAGVRARGGRWADLGAGSGTFSRALADLLGPAGRVHAVDRDRAVRSLARPATTTSAAIEPCRADFTQPLPFDDLDGILLANALHFVRDQRRTVRALAERIRPGGTLMVVEYEQSAARPWVPQPVPFARFCDLAADAGLSAPEEIGRRPSRFGGRTLYAAVAISAHGASRRPTG